MTRKTFALAVRLLAVLAAIYTFFSLRSQLSEQRRPDNRAIQVQVMQPVCGWLTATKATSDGSTPAGNLREVIRSALARPGERIAVSDTQVCEELASQGDFKIKTETGTFRIQFEKMR
jgi:hypothetical protein